MKFILSIKILVVTSPTTSNWVYSLVAQTVKNPPAVQKTRVRSLGWEDRLEEGTATHSSVLTWRISMDRGVWWVTVHRGFRVRHD